MCDWSTSSLLVKEGQVIDDEEVALFQRLIDPGTSWYLSGHCHRVAATLIEAGSIKLPERAEADL